jgi:hypothetical protein
MLVKRCSFHCLSHPCRCLTHQLNVTLETNHDDYLLNARGQWARGVAAKLLTTQNDSYAEPAFNLTDSDGDIEDLQDRFVYMGHCTFTVATSHRGSSAA